MIVLFGVLGSVGECVYVNIRMYNVHVCTGTCTCVCVCVCACSYIAPVSGVCVYTCIYIILTGVRSEFLN